MKKILFASIVAGYAGSAVAGGVGPVIVPAAPVIIEQAASSSGPSFGSLGGGGILAVLALIAIIAAIAGSSSDSASDAT